MTVNVAHPVFMLSGNRMALHLSPDCYRLNGESPIVWGELREIPLLAPKQTTCRSCWPTDYKEWKRASTENDY